MRNAVSLLKHYPPRTALSRIALLACVLAVAIVKSAAFSVAPGSLAAPAGHTPLLARQSSPPASGLSLPGKPDPALAAILLPRHAPTGAYRLTIVDQAIEGARAAVMAALAPAARVDDPAGAWAIRPSDPLEAFGEGGIYDRSRLARLFAGKPAYLARAPIERDGRVVASVTLITPCPDAQLTRLSSAATVAILFDVAAARAR